jgi:NAD-dependent dihydropyrimidine dehydrogenase PreA subunit
MEPNVVICRCEFAGLIPRSKLEKVRASLDAAKVPFTEVPDLCAMAAAKDPRLQLFAKDSTRIVACYPRAVQALFHFGGATLDHTRVLNLRAESAEEILSSLAIPVTSVESESAEPACSNPPAPTRAPNAWHPWFPVIDSSRCTNCQQCLGFCLFGVYGLSAEGKVEVQNPQACKTNCPACARICPEVALIFPKYESGSIAGAEITDESREKDRVQTDLKQILGSDVYTALAQRRAKVKQRQLLRNDLHQAHQERQKFALQAGLKSVPEAPARPSALPGLPRIPRSPS